MTLHRSYTLLGKQIKLPSTVKIGIGTIIYDNVSIGENTIIGANCIIGEPLSDYYTNTNYIQPNTIIGSNSIIRSGTIIYAGNTIGEHVNTGHSVVIRENNCIGNNCSFGTFTDIQGYCNIGNFVRTHSNVHICQHTTIGNFVMVYPFTVFTNDKHPPTTQPIGPSVGDFTQISVHCVIHRGVIIGKHCLVASQSGVTKNTEDYSFLKGNPAERICDVRAIGKIKENELYPWPYRFDRGMPWADIGFEEWKKRQENEGI